MASPNLSAAQRRAAHLSGLSVDVARANNFDLTPTEHAPLRSQLSNLSSGLLAISGTAYWVYLGQTTREVRAAFVQFFVSAAGVGTRAQELVVATTDSGPDRAAKSLTVRAVANTTGNYVAGTGGFANLVSLNYLVAPGAHLWVGARFALTSTPTQPTISALGLDTGKGEVLSTTGQSALVAGTAYTGAIITQSTTLTTAMAPDLVLVLG